jgi:outer membrane receptor for ferrienterochelin and colicins
MNLGADYRFRGTPLTLGGSLNYTPGYRTQVAADQSSITPAKRQLDMFALWVFNPAAQLRLNLSNLFPHDYTTSSTIDSLGLRERSVSNGPTYLNLRVGLELKL